MMKMSRLPALIVSLACLCAGPVFAEDEAVYAQALQARVEATALLERLVNIDSGTGNEPGFDRVGTIVAAELRSLGAHIEQQSTLHDVVLNVEPGRPADGLVVWRKGAGVLMTAGR